MAHKSIWRLAVTPKWIGGLLIALAVASIFAWLGQWQLGRAVETNTKVEIVKSQTVSVILDNQNVFIVSGRLQNSVSGYWLLSNSNTEMGGSVILALGWTKELTAAEQQRKILKSQMIAQAFMPITGASLPSEEPLKLDATKPFLLSSVSTAQLANLIPGGAVMQDNFIAVNAAATPKGLEPINAQISQEAGINWLSAFYFVEWTVFAGFAVFMWWRLLKDAHVAGRLN